MRIIEKTVYFYNELNQEAKETALNDYRENLEHPFLSEDIKDFIQEQLKKHNIEPENDIKPFYSLGYSQGDGVMFEGVFKFKGLVFHVEQSGHYYHENSKSIYGYKPDDQNHEETTAEQDEEFNKVYVEICKEAEKEGYALIEHDKSEENIKEYFNVTETEFFENGGIF